MARPTDTSPPDAGVALSDDPDVYRGTPGRDVIAHAEETPYDTFYGLGGDDDFYVSDSGGGGYYFYGGDGNDRFGGGATVIWMADGGAGDDRFTLSGEYMRIHGGAGNDRIEGVPDPPTSSAGTGTTSSTC